jgi:hypothetical protein
MFDALGGDERVSHLSNPVGATANGENFQTVTMVQVDVQRGNNQIAMIVLDVRQQLHQMRFVMVVHDGNRAGYFMVVPLLMFHELGADHVGNGQRPVMITFFLAHPVQLARQFAVE